MTQSLKVRKWGRMPSTSSMDPHVVSPPQLSGSWTTIKTQLIRFGIHIRGVLGFLSTRYPKTIKHDTMRPGVPLRFSVLALRAETRRRWPRPGFWQSRESMLHGYLLIPTDDKSDA